MRFLRAISRVLIGVIFILSGFFKAIDPIGGGLKIKEYLNAFHLGFLDFMSIPFSYVLAAAEFLIGVAVLKGIKMKFFSGAAFWFMVFFTILTFYSALFNPVQDCGCFGEAIHLTNWETFFKNLVLLGAAAVIFFQRKKFEPIASPRWEMIYICIYVLFIGGISGYAWIKMPQIDLGDYKAGTNLIDVEGSAPEKVYHTVFIYSKDGKEKEFGIDNLPDSTWQFVDSKTSLVSEGGEKEGVDFILKDSTGNYVAGQILESEAPLFFASFCNTGNVPEKKKERLRRLNDTLAANGGVLYILSGLGVEETEKNFRGTGVPLLYSDYKTVLSFNRSNGGLTYIDGGDIIEKWASGNYPFNSVRRILSRDPEVLMANGIIGDQLFAELCLVIIFFMIVIIRFVSKMLYKRYLSRLESLENLNM